jgi:hypothetical protein
LPYFLDGPCWLCMGCVVVAAIVSGAAAPLSVQDFILDRSTYSGTTQTIEGVIACLGISTCLLYPSGEQPNSNHINLTAEGLSRDDRRKLLECPDTVHQCHVLATVQVVPTESSRDVSQDLQYLPLTALQWVK